MCFPVPIRIWRESHFQWIFYKSEEDVSHVLLSVIIFGGSVGMLIFVTIDCELLEGIKYEY